MKEEQVNASLRRARAMADENAKMWKIAALVRHFDYAPLDFARDFAGQAGSDCGSEDDLHKEES